MTQTILRLPAVMFHTGLGRSTIYARIADRLWPQPVNLGARAVGWPLYEVDALNAARIAGQSNDEIRALVVKLEVSMSMFRSLRTYRLDSSYSRYVR